MARNDGGFYIGREVVIEYGGIASMMVDLNESVCWFKATERTDGSGFWELEDTRETGRKVIVDNALIIDTIKKFVGGRWDEPMVLCGAQCLQYVDSFTYLFSWHCCTGRGRHEKMAQALIYGFC